MAERRMRVLALIWVAGGCGGEQGVFDAPGPLASAPILAADYGLCAPVTRRANAHLVWCGALGGTCATPAACDFIDGGPPASAEPPQLPRAREPRLTVYLRKNCRNVVSGAVLFVDGVEVDTLGVGPPGRSVRIAVGSHTVGAESPDGLTWKTFSVAVPPQGLIQPLTCR